MKRPLVSVIMAVYNQGQFVSDAVESVLHQTLEDWELVICDDGSTDYTYEVLDRYRREHPDKIILLRNEKNIGVSGARNRAIRESKGKYIAFLDSDDWWDDRKLEKQAALFQRSPELGLVFTHAHVRSEGAFTEKARLAQERHFNKLCGSGRVDKKCLVTGNNICFSSTMVSRKAIDLAGYFDEHLKHQVEDWVMSLKIIYLFGIAYVPEQLTYYRFHAASYSARFFLREKMGRETFVQIRRIALKFMMKNLFMKEAASTILERISFMAHFRLGCFKDDFISFIQKTPLLLQLVRLLKNVRNYCGTELDRIRASGFRNLFILFVTAKCNSKCKTCFYWKNLDNNKKELELRDIKNMFDTLPKTSCLLITGGEPFLRADIQDMLDLASASRNILSVSINTNGTMPEKVYDVMRETLRKRDNPKQYYLNVSVDGSRDTHNKIRGLDCYDNAIRTLNKISGLKKEFKGLCVSAITVISRDNIAEVEELAKFMFEEMALDFHYFEIIRGEPRARESLGLDKDVVKDIYKDILAVQSRYFEKQGLRDVRRGLDRLEHMYRLQFENFFEGKGWDVRCLAGKKVFVVYEDGNFSACELRKFVTDMKNFNFNMRNVLNSKILKDEIKKIGSDKCFCTHGCFVSNSMPL